MRKGSLFVLALLVALAVFSVTDADARRHGDCYKCDSDAYVQKKVKKMTKKLDLSESQRKEVEAIYRKKMDQKMAVMEDVGEKMETVSETYQANMAKVLNDDQKKEFQSWMDKDGKKWGKKKAGCACK